MFIILLTYKKPLEMVDKYLSEHNLFLEQGYQNNYFIVSGRKKPRTGGVIVSQLTDGKKIIELIKQDPFYIHDISEYEIVEFTPGKHHPDFSKFIE